jgi:hypothetical protein
MTVKKINAVYSNLEQIQSDLKAILETYQDTLDRKSAKWQESEKGEVLTNRIGYLESALVDLDSLMANLDEASSEED